jgi:hypothetical protein
MFEEGVVVLPKTPLPERALRGVRRSLRKGWIEVSGKLRTTNRIFFAVPEIALRLEQADRRANRRRDN